MQVLNFQENLNNVSTPAAISSSQLQKVRSILVIQFRYLGDMVLLSSLFHNLHLHLPQARLAALTDDVYAEILQNVPDLHDIIPFPRKQAQRGALHKRLGAWVNLIRTLRGRRFDMVIDVANTSTSRALVSLLGAQWKVGYRPHVHKKEKTPYNILAEPFQLDVPHFIDHYLSPLRALGLPVLERTPILRPRPEDEQVVQQLLHQHGLKPQQFVAMHPGARVARKCWPSQHFARVVDALENQAGLRTVLVGSANEQPLRDTILQESRSQPVDLVGQLAVGQLVGVMRHSRLFIGNDSGPMHIAAAAGVPVVAVFGPSEARLWAPVGVGHTIVERQCACGLNMKKPTACDVQGPGCLQQITVEEVITAAQKMLATPLPGEMESDQML